MLSLNKKSFFCLSICFILSLCFVFFLNHKIMTNNSNIIRVETENYQDYYDSTSGNIGKAYRDDDVDIWEMKPGAFRVGAIQPGEWLDYNLDVPEDGKYKIVSRVGSTNKRDRKFSVSLDKEQSTTLNFDSHDNKHWQDITSEEIELSKGSHQLRLNMLTTGFSLDYFELVPVSANQNSITTGTGNGLKGEYYNTKSFSDLKLTRTDERVDFNWKDKSPHSSMGADTFSARWTGQVEPLFSETYNFHTITDDGVRLWVDNQLIVDEFVNRRSTEDTATIDLVAGKKYDIRMEYYENSGNANASLAWSSDSQSFEIIPSSQLYSKSIDNKNNASTIVDSNNNSNNMTDKNNSITTGTGNGLKGEYYNTKSFSDLKLTRTDERVDFNWKDKSPHSSMGADTFSARWTGQVEPLFSETYDFHTTTDDGVRLWVDNQLIVDEFVNRRSTEDTATIDLVAGKKYDIRMEYYENSGNANASLAWSSDSQPFEIIPSSQLYSKSSNNTDRNDTTENKSFSTADVTVYENFNDNNLEHFSYQRPRTDSIKSSSLYDRDGSGQSLQFNLYENDKDVQGSRRTEVRLDSDVGEFKIGDETWIGFSVLAPKNYQYDDSFEIIFQMHSYPDFDLGEDWRSPPLDLRIVGGDFVIGHNHDTKAVTRNNTPEGRDEYNLGALKPGDWTDFTLHIDYQLDDSGLIELYRDGELAYSYEGEVGYNDKDGMFTKFGIYKPHWKYNPERSSTNERTLYFDAFRMADGDAGLMDVDPSTIYGNDTSGM